MLDEADLPVAVEIIGLNQLGHESGNIAFTEGRDLAWLQETNSQAVWADWAATYRDVIIVGEDGKTIDFYNLTDNDLATQANFDALFDLFSAAAGE